MMISITCSKLSIMRLAVFVQCSVSYHSVSGDTFLLVRHICHLGICVLSSFISRFSASV